jgi:four helix bundle protein
MAVAALLRSGTSAGANYQEPRAAESRQDFVHKLQIALKETRESHYWLRLIAVARIVPAAKLTEITDESEQLVAILSKAVARTKGTDKESE